MQPEEVLQGLADDTHATRDATSIRREKLFLELSENLKNFQSDFLNKKNCLYMKHTYIFEISFYFHSK